jgi:membrane-associated phospholipid phosphatase
MRGGRRIGRGLPVLLAAAWLATSLRPAEAEELNVDLGLDLGLTLGIGAGWIATELLKPYLAPDGCRWCEPPDGDWAVRNALRWDDTSAADALSYAIGFALVPALSFGLNLAAARDRGEFGDAWKDALVVAEAGVVAAALNQLLKFSVGRERPFVHALDPDDKPLTSSPADNDLSFFSGHTTLAFALAVSAATTATIREYDVAPYLWAIGMLAAGTTGYLRIAADRHYLTDVLVGAAIGALVGWAIPWLHRDDDGESSSTGSLGLPAFSFGIVL